MCLQTGQGQEGKERQGEKLQILVEGVDTNEGIIVGTIYA